MDVVAIDVETASGVLLANAPVQLQGGQGAAVMERNYDGRLVGCNDG